MPDIPITAQSVIDEMSGRISNLTMANIRLTCMIAELVKQRDEALKRWEREAVQNANQRNSNDVLAYKSKGG